MSKRLVLGTVLSLGLVLSTLASPASANHSWGTYHWGRTANPFTVKYGDNVSSQWDSYLDTAIADWSKSTVVKMSKVAGSVGNLKRCVAPAGRVEVCNTTYGFTGWLGIAGISLSGGHIVSGYTKLNDSYYNSATYNKPEWRAMVMCQEIAHNVGLAHQDENFNNANLGSCMDYTNLPLGPPSNTKPNQHDYDQLVTIYGSHLDSTNTSTASVPGSGPGNSAIVSVDEHGNGNVVHVFWVPGAPQTNGPSEH